MRYLAIRDRMQFDQLRQREFIRFWRRSGRDRVSLLGPTGLAETHGGVSLLAEVPRRAGTIYKCIDLT